MLRLVACRPLLSACGPRRRRLSFSQNEAAAVETAAAAAEQQQRSWAELAPLAPAALTGAYARLAKVKLGSQVLLTALAGYAVAPGAADLPTFLGLAAGTGLCVASANSFNQWIEVPFDSQMNRTKTRPLVTGELSPFHAFAFAATTGVVGTAVLAAAVSPLVAALGAGNILLYAVIYTPLKRVSIANTWVGAVVGAVPPLMGWAAVTGTLDPGAFILSGVLFAWQFPHFNSLSWKLQPDYSKAGYRMMSVVDPDGCRSVAFRYSLLLLPICWAAPFVGVTSGLFALDSTALNLYFAAKAWTFYRTGSPEAARRLFLTSLWHLPALMGLMLVHHFYL